MQSVSLKQTSYQFIKFAFVGILNTGIDFLVLNVLIGLFGTGNNGNLYFIFKGISFIAAVINSYLLNKFWVFKHEHSAPVTSSDSQSNSKKELASFITISVLGLFLNILVSSAVFKFSTSLYPSLSQTIWANVGALTGTITVLIFNFFGYKLFVFKK